MNNKVQLITYADRLSGGTLADLHGLLTGPLAGAFGGVHILPFFYPIDGRDAGFDPIDHTRIDARLGTWEDIAALSRDVPVMADVVVNHISNESPQFLDYARHGSQSAHSGLFLTLDSVFPQGATEADLLAIHRPLPGAPFTWLTLANGERKILWNTFTPAQLDLNVQHPLGRAYLETILKTLAQHGVTMLRLDAVGYTIKKPGTSCFMLPETFAFIESMATAARALGLEVLVETHAHYLKQIAVAQRVDWVYDFALPPLALHALFFKTAGPMAAWIAQRPTNALTVLDTHDGIGIIDAGPDPEDPKARPGLVSTDELDQVVEQIHLNSGGQSRQATGAAADNLDLYQVNCTFYDAVGRNDQAYLLARALQFFLPGVPQVYYVGLLAGSNDMALLARTGAGRDINRHYYDTAEVTAQLARPVVQDLLALIRLRNSHPAFNGQFGHELQGPAQLRLHWTLGTDCAELQIDFAIPSFIVRTSGPQGMAPWPLRSLPASTGH